MEKAIVTIRLVEKDEGLYIRVRYNGESKLIDSGMEWGEPEFGDDDVFDAINAAFPELNGNYTIR